MLRTYADFRVNYCGSWRMSADVRYKSADVRASVKACGLLRTFFRISWGYLFEDVRSSMQVSLRTSAKACVKFWLCIFLLRTCADILDLEKIRHWRKLHMPAKILADICRLLKYCHTHFEQQMGKNVRQCTHSNLTHTQNSTILNCKQLTNSNEI